MKYSAGHTTPADCDEGTFSHYSEDGAETRSSGTVEYSPQLKSTAVMQPRLSPFFI